jgi:RNA polymerase sigma-70 factor (ECF subfamily)
VVCENRYATILAHRRAQKRSHAREGGSLNRPIQDAEGDRTEFGATVSESEQARHTGQHRRPQQELCELTQDVARVLDQLPPLMRKVCEIVMRDSKAAAARQLGKSQGALYEVLGRVLTRFDKAGLRGYLK